MPLPPKSYFFLEELTGPWGATLADFACYAQEERLQLSVMTVGIAAEIQEPQDGDDGFLPVTVDFLFLHGPQLLYPGDAWEMFQHGVRRVRLFRHAEPDKFVRLRAEKGVEVKVTDLLVTREERERFERQYGLCEVATPVPPAAHTGFSHSANYTSVTLVGQSFTLGQRQAAVVRLLHEAALAGSPWLSGSDLLARAGARSDRLVDLFKTKPHWRDLIVSDGQGRWRLNLGETEQRIRAYRRPYLRLVS